MDDTLAQRLRRLQRSGRVRPSVVTFVGAELEALAAEGHTVTAATAGRLARHLMTALSRLLTGEPVELLPTEEEVTTRLTGCPEAVDRARAMAVRAHRTLGASLPTSVIDSLAVSIAELPRRSPEPS